MTYLLVPIKENNNIINHRGSNKCRICGIYCPPTHGNKKQYINIRKKHLVLVYMKFTKKTTKKPYKKKTVRKITKNVPMKAFKQMFNRMAEKKRFYIAPIDLTNGDISCKAPQSVSYAGGTLTALTQPMSIGQQFANGTLGGTTVGGWVAMDITPYPVETNGFGGREGSSINLNSSYMQFKFTQMSVNTLTPIKIRMRILHVLGAPQTPHGVMEAFYLNSALPNGTNIGSNNGLIDYNSNISPDQRGQFKEIYHGTTTLWQDNVDAGLQVKNHVIKLKYNKGAGHIIRYLQNTITPVGGQLIMLITCDAGNVSGNAYAGSGSGTLINNAALSGASCNFNICHYYTDP